MVVEDFEETYSPEKSDHDELESPRNINLEMTENPFKALNMDYSNQVSTFDEAEDSSFADYSYADN